METDECVEELSETKSEVGKFEAKVDEIMNLDINLKLDNASPEINYILAPSPDKIVNEDEYSLQTKPIIKKIKAENEAEKEDV